MEKTVRFGIIGFGNMGTGHANNFRDGRIGNGVLAAVADIDPEKLKNVKNYGENIAVYGSGEELIEKSDVDAVVVATPHYLHPPLCTAALKRGFNVVCEKPAGVYTRQVKEMNEAAKQAKGLFTMMFNQRTNPVYRKMREIILSGGIGTIKRVNWIITDWYRSQSYYDSGTWRATWSGEGGGVLINQCPHQLDLVQWVTGLRPSAVRAFCHFGKWHDIEVEDDVTAYLEYPGGATGAFITSTADCPGDNRFEVLGTLGKLVCDGGSIQYDKLKIDEREFNRTYRGGFGTPEWERIPVEIKGENSQHAGILTNFARAILGLEPLFVDGKEGIYGVELMNAMLLSTWLKKTVSLPVDEELYFDELMKRVKTSKVKTGSNLVLDTQGTYGSK